MTHVLLVGAGGCVGSILRYWLSGVAHRWTSAGFPVGTLAVNLLGCLAIGAVLYLVDYRRMFSPDARVFLVTGILGGFTTFSAFGYETFALLRESQWWAAGANVVGNVVFGVGAVVLGWMAAKALAG